MEEVAGLWRIWDEGDVIPKPVAAALLALLATLPFLIAGAVIEARHYRRLAQQGAELARIRLLAGSLPGPELPPGLTGIGHVHAGVALCPPPLARLQVLIRQLIGGRVDLYHRLADRARREALLRLRRQVVALGGDGAVGVRLGSASIARNRVCIHAYGLAVRGMPPTDGTADPSPIPEAAGSPPAPRKRALTLLVLGGGLGAALAGFSEMVFFLLDDVWVFNDLWVGIKRFIARTFRI